MPPAVLSLFIVEDGDRVRRVCVLNQLLKGASAGWTAGRALNGVDAAYQV